MLTTVSTTLQIAQSIRVNPVTPKQLGWLQNAEKDFQITIDFTKISTVGQASALISKIQSAINNKTVKPRVTQVSKVRYAIVNIDGIIAIKSFIGTPQEAFKKATTMYSGQVLNMVDSIDEAKTFAINAKESLSKSDSKLTVEELNALTLRDLRLLASDMGVQVKKGTVKAKVIDAIISAVA